MAAIHQSSATSLLQQTIDRQASLNTVIRLAASNDKPILGTYEVSTVDQHLARYISNFPKLPPELRDLIDNPSDQSAWCRITIRLANHTRFLRTDAWTLWNRYLPDILNLLYAVNQTTDPEALPILTGQHQLPINELTIPHEYQRDLSEIDAKNLAQHWDPYAVDPITVSRRRDGTLVIVDGQHRWRAAQLLRHQQIFAKIFRVIITPEREASIHKTIGIGHKKLTPFDLFKTERAFQAPDVIAIDAILAQHSFTLARQGKRGESRQISAITSIRQIYRKDQGAMLNHILSVANASWPHEARILHKALIEGLATFLYTFQTHPNYKESKLIERLRLESPQDLASRAQNTSATQRLRVDIAAAYAIGRAYNYKRKASNWLPLSLLES